jgi:hypothetical protein
MTDTIDLNALNTTCDGLFLLVDTARHNGFTPDDADIREHIRTCPKCFDVNAEHLD